ncbi:phosphoglycerate mutase-like protein [Teratosphaeria nubilosa]|uniref:Phosphoglycerate mutase-like protein n=1 Tax=Teratosphaeria nubilosa TaxID=161662 RepID=A0A6G1LA27_9PEZI|nr:phosphoglycerate mutase-like protein [Teratosphaeria nubilosa]
MLTVTGLAASSASAVFEKNFPEALQTDDDQLAGDGDWDIRYHLGGNSPWIPKVNGTIEGGFAPPGGCHVDQVHMLARHAERYPTVNAGIKMLEFYDHLRNVTLEGDLAFANEWKFFMSNPEQHLEKLVAVGPYAGTLEAFTTGVKLRTRYEHLVNEALANNQTSFWASDSGRVVETAKNFVAGLFGIDWADLSTLHIVPETTGLAGNTLTPGKTCRRYRSKLEPYGRDYGARMLYEWRGQYLPPIIERLKQQNPNVTWSESEVYSMQELCGFETLAKGSSQWCDVFTHEEWEQFEYARDLLHYYRSGPGNPFSTTMGMLWLNATANLLHLGPVEAGPLFFSFVHDGDIIPMLAALDLFPQRVPLPTDHVLEDRNWRTSDVVPMGGRIIVERLACNKTWCWDQREYGYPNHVYCDDPVEEYFVRINVNDGMIPLPRCHNGPGWSCPLDKFLDMMKARAVVAGDFGRMCGLQRDAAKGISFLHQ